MPRPNRGARLEPNDQGVYEVRWTEHGRSKRISTRTTDAAEAADFLREWRLGLEREKARAGASTVRAVLDAYFAEHVYKKVVGQGTAEIARKHLVAHFGAMHPAEILPADVREYARKRERGDIGKGASGPTVRRDLSVLVAALNHAVTEKRLKRADVPSIPLPEGSIPRDRWLTEDEVQRVVTLARGEALVLPRIYRFVMLAYYTAARRRSIETLRWSQVDWDASAIRLQEPGRRQTKKRRPTVPMHPRLRDMMERAFVERTSEYVLDHSGSVRSAFESLMRRAELTDVTPHTLRHTSASHMLRRGQSIESVAGILGDTVKTVATTYHHHLPEALRETVEVLR